MRLFFICLLMFGRGAAAENEKHPLDLTRLTDARAHGFVILMFENMVMRQSSLSWDGERFHLLIADMPTHLLDLSKAKITEQPYPKSDLVVTRYEWDLPEYPHVISVLVRDRAVRDLENRLVYDGSKTDLPKMIVLFKNRAANFVEIQGALFTQDQDKSALDELITELKQAGGTYISFIQSDLDLCRLRLERARIRVRDASFPNRN